MRLRIGRELGFGNVLPRHTHSPRPTRHSLPESWIEAREKATALPCDDTQTIGDVFDKAISMIHHAIRRDKRVLRGIPCLRNRRIPVYQICGMVAEGYSTKRVSKYLSISEENVNDALRFASILLEQ